MNGRTETTPPDGDTTSTRSLVAWIVKNCGTCQGDPSKCVKKCAYYGKKAG